MDCPRLETALNFLKYLESVTNHIFYVKANVNFKFAPPRLNIRMLRTVKTSKKILHTFCDSKLHRNSMSDLRLPALPSSRDYWIY